METPKEYYYTYYSYEEWGKGYFGSRKCYCLPEEDVKYFGSFKDKNFKPTQKIILKDDYAIREEAYADEIILQEYYKVVENPHFANRSYQKTTKFCVPREISVESGKIGGKISGKKHKENKTGVCGLAIEQCKKYGKIGGKIGGNKSYEFGVGIHGRTKEQMTESGKKGGNKTKELNVGICGLTYEHRKKYGKMGGMKTKELGFGIFGLTEEQKKENANITNSQKWMCTETGFITTPGPLTTYQRKRGIDKSKRIRLE